MPTLSEIKRKRLASAKDKQRTDNKYLITMSRIWYRCALDDFSKNAASFDANRLGDAYRAVRDAGHLHEVLSNVTRALRYKGIGVKAMNHRFIIFEE